MKDERILERLGRSFRRGAMLGAFMGMLLLILVYEIAATAFTMRGVFDMFTP